MTVLYTHLRAGFDSLKGQPKVWRSAWRKMGESVLKYRDAVAREVEELGDDVLGPLDQAGNSMDPHDDDELEHGVVAQPPDGGML